MTPPTVAIEYVAGVIDARGHITLNVRHERPQPRVRITTAKVALLEHLASLTGASVVTDERGYEQRRCGEHCAEKHVHVARQSAQWTADSSRATIILWNVLPHLVAQRGVARRALLAGLDSYPAARGDTAKRMAALGWPLPEIGSRAALDEIGTSP